MILLSVKKKTVVHKKYFKNTHESPAIAKIGVECWTRKCSMAYKPQSLECASMILATRFF